MKIAILLPYKENYVKKYSGAVSIFVSNILESSFFKKNITIYGNTEYKNFLSKNYINLKFDKGILKSNNSSYVNKFIEYNLNENLDLIEIHNRPFYIDKIFDKIKTKIILYIHNDPLNLKGSKSIQERLTLLKRCDHIFFNSYWTKNRFFKGIEENNFSLKTSVCYQSTKKYKINLNKKKKIISFVGKLNSAKGYDIFGKAIIKILDEFPNWKSIVVGDESREKYNFFHRNLKIHQFKDNKFILDLFKKTSIAVSCPKWEEPFGRSSLEACSMGCATIITNRGGLTETTKHPILLKKHDFNELYKLIKKIILNEKYRKRIQKLNYNSFTLSNNNVSKEIDKVRKSISINFHTKYINLNNLNNLKILHITNFNLRYFGRLQFNTSVRLNNGLIRQGHNVMNISDRDLLRFSKSLFDFTGEKNLNRFIKKSIDTFQPDLIILGHADKVDENVILEAKNKYKNLRVAQWFLDPISKFGPDYEKNKKRILSKSIFCDTSFITTSPDVLDFKINNAFYMPNPCDLSLDYLKNFNNEKIYDLFYSISHGVHREFLRPGKIDQREIFISKLKKKCPTIKFDTYGMFGKEPIWGIEFLNQISNSRMALNLSRGRPIKYYSSDRIAQLMGNGLLTFIHKDTMYQDFFTKDEMIFYSDISDLSEKINKYKKDDYSSKRIAKKGYLKYHKYFNSNLVSKFIIEKTFGLNRKKYFWENI